MARRQRHNRPTTTSNTYRFFVPAETLSGRTFQSDDAELAHQLERVLRLQPGDEVHLLDNSGWQYSVQLTQIDRRGVAGDVLQKQLAGGEPRTKLALYTAIMRAERFEWVLQKGTELGATSFVPLICERSALADANELGERKLVRWGRIIREAAEQARRARLPQLAPALFFADACQQAARRGPALLLWEGEGVVSLRSALRGLPAGVAPLSVAVLSGPEGGLSQAELQTARDYGIIPVSLGPRTLRAETAPLAAATAILYELGDLD